MNSLSRDEKICVLYAWGVSLEEIGKRVKLSRERVRQIVREAGVTRGRQVNRKKRADYREVYAEYLTGKSFDELAEKYGYKSGESLRGVLYVAGYRFGKPRAVSS